jgi:heat shock protein HslJ
MRVLLICLALITLAGCKYDESVSGYTASSTVWSLTELDGEVFTPRATIAFPEKGKVSGTGPCNSFSASQTVPLPWIEIRNLVSTKMACPDLSMETVFFSALGDMSLAEVAGNVMILSNESGREMVFRTAP